MPFFNKNWFRQFLASWLILAFLATLILTNVLLPRKEAQAINATLPMQIVHWILDKISWVKDYAIQNLQKSYQKVISQIQQWTKSDILNQRALRKSWNKTRAELLKQLTNDIIKWAQGTSGNPNFVIEWRDYLTDLSGQAGQDFIDNQLTQANTCTTADGETLGQKTQEIFKRDSTFQEEIECPLADLVGFQNDFENGGWDAWTSALYPSGNLAGTYLLASDELMYEMGQTYDAEKSKLTANQGFKGNKKTPGIVQSYATQRASMMDFDYLLNSDDLDEYFSSVVDAFINRIIDEGLEHMQTDTYQAQGEIPQVTLTETELDLNYVKSRYGYAVQLLDMLALIKENLQTKLSEQSQNLSLMNQIKSVQDQIIANGCQPVTSLINGEIATLNSEISQTNTKINQTDQASNNLESLITIMDQVIEADRAGNEELLEQTLSQFETAHGITVASLQALLGTQESDLQYLYDEAGEYSLTVVEETNGYIEQRGSPYDTGSGVLYGRLYQENVQLASCPPPVFP